MIATGRLKSLLSKLMQNTSLYLALFSGAMVVALIVVVCYEVWMRFVVKQPVGWAIEIPRLMFMTILFLGLSYTTRSGGHVGVDAVTSRLPRRIRVLLATITSFIALGVSAVVLWQSLRILVDSFVQKWYTATIVPIIEWPFFVAMVLGSFIMCLEWIGKIMGNWRALRDFGKAPSQGGDGSALGV